MMRQDRMVRSVFGSILVNGVLLGLLLLVHAQRAEPKRSSPIVIEMLVANAPTPAFSSTAATGFMRGAHDGSAKPASGSRGGATTPPSTRHARPQAQPLKASESPWSGVVESIEGPDGNGIGNGNGNGIGNGIGFGDGGSVRSISSIPDPPAPPPSRARAAKLRHPARQRPVEDDRLYVAIVTVDEEGDVVGAHMIRGEPGARGDLASSVIWHFHYEPALDAQGRPVRSTFKQEFQIW